MAAVTTGTVAMAWLAGAAAPAACPGIQSRAISNAPAPSTVEAIKLMIRPKRIRPPNRLIRSQRDRIGRGYGG